MKKHLVGACCLLAVVVVGRVASGNARSESVGLNDPEHERHGLAVDLVRAINTAELDYKMKHGVYANWGALVANGDFTATGTKWGRKDSSRLANMKFSDNSEVLPGWKLRLNLAADGKSFDLLLEDATDEKCGYAAITDERGVIRQGKAIDCPI